MAIAVAQRLLKKLGQRLTFKYQIRRNGKQVRFYQGCQPNTDGREAVFDYWLSRDEKLTNNSNVTPFCKEDIYKADVTKLSA